MRFGGHQTFAIREGWLYKGLRMAMEEPERLGASDLSDWLGVGRNMAKSIHYWLQSTGLAEPDSTHGPRTRILRPTALGREVWTNDRYFLQPGTWWAIHIELVNNVSNAYSWHWFFNHFSAARFERPVCVESLRRHLAATGQRLPASRTLDRDVNCLLRSYSQDIPREVGDPEDILECPLSELGLLVHSRQTGFFHLNLELKAVPFALFVYALTGSKLMPVPRSGAGQVDLSLTDLTYRLGAPGRMFAMTAEAAYELIAGFEAKGLVRLDVQAGERIVRLAGEPPLECLRRYYTDVADNEEQAA